MRIAHIVCTYPPYYGGMGSVALEMVSGLIRLGHEVEVFTPLLNELPEEHLATARRVKPTLALGNAAWLPGLVKELAAFDLVHLHYPFFGTAGSVARFRRLYPEKPLVVTYHMDTRAPGWKGLIFKMYNRFWMPRILAAADAITVSSFDYAAQCQAKASFEIQKEKWFEIPFGVDTDRFYPGSKSVELFSRHELDPNIQTLLFVGGMDAAHYFKGIPVLLDAVADVVAAGREVQLVCIGDGEHRADFERMAWTLGIKKQTRFVGSVSAEELPAYYRMADLFVLPSINHGEAFGMVLLEAMASGVPVLATDIPGVRVVALGGGFVIPPNDPGALAGAIDQFFSLSNEERQAWSQKAREYAATRYRWAPILEQLDQLYTGLVLKNKKEYTIK